MTLASQGRTSRLPTEGYWSGVGRTTIALVAAAVIVTVAGLVAYLARLEPLGSLLFLGGPALLAGLVACTAALPSGVTMRERSGPLAVAVLVVPPAVGIASALAFAIGLAVPAMQAWVRRSVRDPLSLLHDHASAGVQLVLVGLVPAVAALVGVLAVMLVALAVAIVVGGLRGIAARLHER